MREKVPKSSLVTGEAAPTNNEFLRICPFSTTISEDFLVLALREGPKICEDKIPHYLTSMERVFRPIGPLAHPPLLGAHQGGRATTRPSKKGSYEGSL